MKSDRNKIEIQNLTMAYGSRVVMRDITAKINQGSVFVIMGNSGSGKSTLLRHLIGLQCPAQMSFTMAKAFGEWTMNHAKSNSANTACSFKVARCGVR